MRTFEDFINEATYSIRKAEVPNVKVLYHTSNPFYRKNIEQEGLIPKVGDSYSMHYDFDENLMPGIFLSVDKYDSTYDDDIYEIEVSKLNQNKLFKDPDAEIEDGWFIYTEVISKDAIKLIHKGTGK